MRVFAIAIALLAFAFPAMAETHEPPTGQHVPAGKTVDEAFEAKFKARSTELARNPAFRKAVDALDPAEDAYMESRLVDELGLGEDERLERLHHHMEAMRALMSAVVIGMFPAQPSGTMAQAEQALDANLTKAAANKSLGPARLKGIEATQKKWLEYCDALINVVRLATPEAAEPIRRMITRERGSDLAALVR